MNIETFTNEDAAEDIGSMGIIDLMNAAERWNAAGRKDKTISLYRSWLEHSTSPLAYVACFNLGVELAGLREHAQAEEMYRKALEQTPDFIQARVNLGNSLEQLKRQDEALEQWRTALELPAIKLPDNRALHLHALNNLGRLLEIKRRFREALSMLDESFALDTTQKDVLYHMVHLREKICTWPIIEPPKGITETEMIEGSSPLAMLALSDDPAMQLFAARQFVERKYQAEHEQMAPAGGYNHDKIRIGYLSSDLSTHAVSILTVELFERHDRERFEVYGFCWSREDGTAFRQRVVSAMDRLVRIGELSDKEAAESIRAHEIDVLVDLQGLTSGARPSILAHRPAPLQITYLGFPGPTGLPWIDYVVADRYLIPDQLTEHFTEKPLYLPHCFQVSDSKREVAPKPSRADYSLPKDAFVFCTFNNNYKYTPEMFAIWMSILKRVPKSVLWLLADNEWAHENLVRAAKKHGIKAGRLIFAPRVAPPAYLARYQLADLFLDTFPFNGGTTANDALWMGLPLLTYSGRTFASRMAGSLLTNLGLPELIATGYKEYEEKAVRLARNPRELGRIKEKLQQNKSQGSPFDIPMFVREFEGKLLDVLEELKSCSNAAAAGEGCCTVSEGGGADDDGRVEDGEGRGAAAASTGAASTDAASTDAASTDAASTDAASAEGPAKSGVAAADPPLVSILIPSYKAQYFEFALKSAIGQSYRNTEIIVSDDCPTDDIEKIVARYQAIKPIRYDRNKNPDGVGTNNHINCLRLARGEYVKFLNDDDALMPFAVQYMLDAFVANAASNPRLVVSERWYIDGQDRFLGANRLPVQQLADITDHFVERFMALRNANMLGEFTTAMWRRDDSFDENDVARFTRVDGREIVALVDVAMWINLAQLGRVLYIPLPLSCFRKHGAQNSSATGSEWYYRMATEWEIVTDNAINRKLVTIEEALPALDALLLKYRGNEAAYPPLKSFGDRLEARLADLRAVQVQAGQ